MNSRGKTVKLRELLLRCYAERDEDGSWFAICLQLNLYARGDSLKEVQRELHGIISSYLKEAVNDSHAADLIPRPAPMYFWLRYFYIWCCAKIRDAQPDYVKYKEVLPLVPAA